MALRRVLVTAALTFAALLGMSLTAAAQDRPPRGELYLSISAQQPDSGEMVFVAQADLTCGPTGGTHSEALRACVELMLADGDFDQLRGDDEQVCTLEYAPVVATAEGRWRDQVVAWQQMFSNRCLLDAATGPVFQL
jgi:hypothetical protein